ncbi:MAG: deoxyguanosinetriphosphate triphosphohydrolase [Planctomycetota bacterium]|nr:deoxyguanosinetriphosphate triphosphohydrolase [Planctomycetota bacterium]
MTNAPLTPREAYERAQEAFLAPYAVGFGPDEGRRAVTEEEHDYRTCFQRDRDRIIHCSAFRRLDFKTQVFVPHEHDHFRTRMTHTLEVAQVARTLARALRANEDLAETVALAHDLGHPPFGHGGEKVLDERMAGHGGFEHNRQSLRIVDVLEHPYPAFRGLNLTHVVRECMARHETRYDAPSGSEFPPGLQGPLEGQLVDLADEIAYTSADLEDALAVGWITEESLAGQALWDEAVLAAAAADPGARAIHRRIRACKAVLAGMADDLLATTRANLAAAGVGSADDVRRAGGKLASFSPRKAADVEALQRFLEANVYCHELNLKATRSGQAVIGDLFDAYVADPSLLPGRYQQRIAADGLERVVCDYVAGMTDRYCREKRETLLNRKR